MFEYVEKKISILLVDDDEDEFFLFQDLLLDGEDRRFSLKWVSDYDDALEAIKTGFHDICLIDYHLGEKSGLDLIREPVVKKIDIPIIMVTGLEDREVDLMAMKYGAFDYLVKGAFDYPLLERSIRYSLERHKLLRQLKNQQEIIQRDLETAQQIQKHFLPDTFPFKDFLRFGTFYYPCSHVGGDLYGAFGLREGIAGFHIADVSGHGVSAALISAVLKVSIDRCRASELVASHQDSNNLPAETDVSSSNGDQWIARYLSSFLSGLNGFMGDVTQSSGFVTFLIGMCRLNTGELFLGCAGHNPPLLWHSDSKEVEVLKLPSNLPLGIIMDFQYKILKTRISVGDKLLFYTDGVTELQDEDEKEFGIKSLVNVLSEHGNKDPDTLVKCIESAMKDFRGNSAPTDDQALFVIEYLKNA
jgi:serine phosphatase RsbU (regulator of sigma subunit)